MYIVPQLGDTTIFVEKLKRSEVPFSLGKILGDTLREYNDDPVHVAFLTSNALHTLHRYAPELVHDVPTVITSAPGLIYDGDWMSTSAAFPVVDYLEFEQKIKQSGATARNPHQLAVRGSKDAYTEGSLPAVDDVDDVE